MRLTLAVGVVLLAVITATAQVQSPADVENGRIAGYLVTTSGELVADATVTLRLMDDQGVGFETLTTRSDQSGAFSFSQLPEGRYRIVASRPGYTSRQFADNTTGAVAAFDVGPAVDLGADAQVNVQVLLRRTASVAGRIIRQDGSAAADVPVQLAIRSGSSRLPLFETQVTSQPDGRYEIIGLPPGEYLVGARNTAMLVRQQISDLTGAGQPARDAAAAAASNSHMTWYPGVADSEPGTALTLYEGINAEGIDIWLAPARRFSVSGRVFWPVGVTVDSISIDYGDPTGTTAGTWTVSDPGGLFTLSGIAPGPLTLLGHAESDQGSLIGMASTDVTVDSVEDVRIVVDRPGIIAGRIAYEGNVPPSGRATSVVAVQKLLKVSALYPVPESVVGADGRFALAGLLGEYEFALAGLQSGLAIKKVTRNGRPLSTNRIGVAGGETIRDIEIVVGP
jgi:hypothetical protein